MILPSIFIVSFIYLPKPLFWQFILIFKFRPWQHCRPWYKSCPQAIRIIPVCFPAISQKQQQQQKEDDFAQLDNIAVYLFIIYYWKYYGDINNS